MIDDYRAACRQVKLSRLLSGGYGKANPWASQAQWHLWTDGDSCISAIRVGNSWHPGPETSYADTNNPDFIKDTCSRLLRSGVGGKKFNTLGVLFHAADDFSLSPVRSGMSSPEMYSTAELSIADDPTAIIEEKAGTGFTWQYVPLPGARSATAVRFQSERAAALESVCEVNSPVRLGVYSASLEMLSAIEGILRMGVEEGMETGLSVALLCYRRFTMLVVFSESGILSLANLPHGQRVSPPGIVERITTEVVPHNASGAKCSLWVVEASPFTGAFGEVVKACRDHTATNATFADTFVMGGLTFDAIHEELGKLCDHLPAASNFRPEFVWPDATKGKPVLLPAKTTGGNLSKVARSVAGMQISGFEAAMVLFLNVGKIAAVLGILVAVGFAAFGIFLKMQEPAWKLKPAEATMVQMKAAKLVSIDKGIEQWRKALRPRSSAWATMEMVSRLIPENSGALVRSVSYSVEGVRPADQAAGTEGQPAPEKIGFKRYWRIDGVADERGAAFVDTISNEAIAQVFGAVARDTKQESFASQPTRTLQARATRGAQSPESVGGKVFNSSFTIIVEQSFTAEDELALPTQPIPLPQPTIL